jgi:hypothetical protein
MERVQVSHVSVLFPFPFPFIFSESCHLEDERGGIMESTVLLCWYLVLCCGRVV